MSGPASLPPDPRLPGLAVALDREALLAELRARLPECREGAEPVDVMPHDVQYRPGEQATLLLKVKLQAEGRMLRPLIFVHVLPLDVPSLEEARPLVERLSAEVGVFKVGLQLFIAAGPAAVHLVHEAGARCFLDLKLHDIPATVGHAVSSACELGVAYLTLHAANGPACLTAAAAAAEGHETTLLAVTVLTSLDGAELEAIGIEGTPSGAAQRLGRLATRVGIGGLVCSPHEAGALREELGADVCLMVPGVRPAGSATGDQRRTATPAAAIAALRSSALKTPDPDTSTWAPALVKRAALFCLTPPSTSISVDKPRRSISVRMRSIFGNSSKSRSRTVIAYDSSNLCDVSRPSSTTHSCTFR